MMYKNIVLALGVLCLGLSTYSNAFTQEVTISHPFNFRKEINSSRDFINPPSSKDLLSPDFVVAIARYQPKSSLFLIDKLLRNTPTTANRDELNLTRGTLFLNKGDFNRARYYLEQVNESTLTGDAIAEWKVKLAYSLLRSKPSSSNLATLFYDASESNGYWGQVAKLYMASELLSKGKTKEAKNLYENLKNNLLLCTEAEIGEIACIYYEGKNKEAIDLAKNLLKKIQK